MWTSNFLPFVYLLLMQIPVETCSKLIVLGPAIQICCGVEISICQIDTVSLETADGDRNRRQNPIMQEIGEGSKNEGASFDLGNGRIIESLPSQKTRLYYYIKPCDQLLALN